MQAKVKQRGTGLHILRDGADSKNGEKRWEEPHLDRREKRKKKFCTAEREMKRRIKKEKEKREP